MTEYDYSPEGYQRYLDTQRRISRWVDDTNAHSSEFRAPFGARSDVDMSSGSGTPTSSSSRSKSRHRSVYTQREVEERGRRNSISGATLRPGVGSNVPAHTYATQRSTAYTPQVRHSYPYPSIPQTNQAPFNPSSRPSAVVPGGTMYAVPSPSSQRRSQSLSSRLPPPPAQSQFQSPSQTYTHTPPHHHRPHHRDAVPHSSTQVSHSRGLELPKRSATLPAAYIANPNPHQSSATISSSQHTRRSQSTTHRSSHSHSNSNYHRSSHHHHHHHHNDRGYEHGLYSSSSPRSQSTPRSSSFSSPQKPIYSSGTVVVPGPNYAVVDNRAYAAEPGGYVVIPPKGRKMSVIRWTEPEPEPDPSWGYRDSALDDIAKKERAWGSGSKSSTQ
ncbi:hypothetical protein GYMLUDRAFT_76523 [Collybiopsis luxurians FD-317 M1]|uniref:Uncharacterized protein n=1 Tax=Collybiopsis luxurians FD-317 M1 TaxID=944289 RepID=A0A0D0BZR9_9AGAR|nr:hypothetical protein GYMLUDRAFT_76523 [Collybiopsis luxurians FD-317 M1]